MARSSVPTSMSRKGQRLWPTALILTLFSFAAALMPVARVSGSAAVVFGVGALLVLAAMETLRRQHRDAASEVERQRGEVREREVRAARRDAHWHTYVNGQAELVREEVEFVVKERLPAALTRREVPPSLHSGDQLGDGLAEWLDRLLTEVTDTVGHREESQRLAVVELASRVQTSAHRIQATVTGLADRYPSDADLLESTMKVDHAATQQARHAQSLKVLCGEWPGQQWQKPLALVDVVRAASGRIVAFNRVEVSGDPDVGITPSLVEPLIHLMAELLANATEYSPPKTGVPVTVRTVQRGAVIEVDDGGLGLDEYRLSEAREIVSGQRLLGIGEIGEIPQTGFAVVGRFADRHGFSVDLGPSPYGGVRAVVLVPLDVLETLAPAGTSGGRVVPTAQPVPPAHQTAEADRTAQPAQAVPVAQADSVAQAAEPVPAAAGPAAAGPPRTAPGATSATAPEPAAAPAAPAQTTAPAESAALPPAAPPTAPAPAALAAAPVPAALTPAPAPAALVPVSAPPAAGRLPARRPSPLRPAVPQPPAPEPAVSDWAIPAQTTSEPVISAPVPLESVPAADPAPAPAPAADSRPSGISGRLPQRRSRRGAFAPAVEAAPTAVMPPGSPEEAGIWMEQFFEGGRSLPPVGSVSYETHSRPSSITTDPLEGQT
ncbi:ATP-binding protein [Streptomyces sp. NPDC088725]|uniref:ATP-binding protein n=1 Tax=Streptomyces sp. NPDC088725 TaxID=3365873 RepID=UPI00381238FC